MNDELLRYKRRAMGYMSREEMAERLKMSQSYYRRRETKLMEFTPKDMVSIVEVLSLSLEEFNDIFFDGKLPYGNTRSVDVA